MDLDRAAWFMAGLFIGNFLDTFTTITLLFIWVVIRNQAMPLCLGGFYPQNVLANFFQLLNIWVSLIIPSKIFPNKSAAKNLSDQASPQIQNLNNIAQFISPKARIEEIDESEVIIDRRLIRRTNLQGVELPSRSIGVLNMELPRRSVGVLSENFEEPPKPITLLVNPVEMSKSMNYSQRPFQLIVPPRVNLIDPASYANNAKLKLIIS